MHTCRHLFVRHMDAETRAAYRQVDKQACQDVSAATQGLRCALCLWLFATTQFCTDAQQHL